MTICRESLNINVSTHPINETNPPNPDFMPLHGRRQGPVCLHHLRRQRQANQHLRLNRTDPDEPHARYTRLPVQYRKR